MLDDAFINCLLDDLENTVFENGGTDDGSCSRGNYFADERVGAKSTRYAVGNAIEQGRADKGKSCEEDGVAVADVGKGDGIVVAPW